LKNTALQYRKTWLQPAEKKWGFNRAVILCTGIGVGQWMTLMFPETWLQFLE
jgi:hypothetical protein